MIMIDRKTFRRVLGPLEEILVKISSKYQDYENLLTSENLLEGNEKTI